MKTLRQKKILRLLLLKQFICRKIQRRHWVHPVNQKRNCDGEHVKLDEMFQNYPDRFAAYTRMTPNTYSKLLELVGSSLTKKHTNWRQPISARIRLYVLIRYLATGDSLRTFSTNFSIGYSTIWSIVHHDLPVLWNSLKNGYVKAPTKDNWGNIADEFYLKWNLPNCIGAIDGKHVVLEAPPHSGSLYFNYKGTFSIILLATCDANYNFTTIDVGGYGKQSDGGILSGSTLGKKLQNDTLDICNPRKLPNTDTEMSCFFVGDEAFPLSTKMMRPFPGKDLTLSKRIFTYRLSRGRRCIENAFGIMTARWRIFRKPIAATPKQAEWIVLACVALHNFVKKEDVTSDLPETFCNENELTGNRCSASSVLENESSPSALLNQPRLSIAAQERLSKQMRENLMSYFMNEGAVDWQLSSIGAE